MTLQEENDLLKEQIRMMKEIETLKQQVALKPWPSRVAGMDMDLFRGNCLS